MQIFAIVAMDSARGIGKNGKIPWYLPEDWKHFKETTLGCPVIMGRKTYESIGKPLPGRRNIILSSSVKVPEDGEYIREEGSVEYFREIDDALWVLQNDGVEKCFICGGSQIYRAFFDMNLLDEVILSLVKGTHEADTYFPKFEKNFREVSREDRGEFEIIHFIRN